MVFERVSLFFLCFCFGSCSLGWLSVGFEVFRAGGPKKEGCC